MNDASSSAGSECTPASVLPLLVFFLATGAVAFFASRFKPGAWYQAQAKPAWTMPDAVFAPVWTVLYIAIALAGWLVWCAAGGWHIVLALWLLQLVLNALWSPLMFGLHRPLWALLDMAALLAVAIGFIVFAAPLDMAAALLFVPYALWLAFAALLNADLWYRNRYRPMPPFPRL